jgi:hypothetical protein
MARAAERSTAFPERRFRPRPTVCAKPDAEQARRVPVVTRSAWAAASPSTGVSPFPREEAHTSPFANPTVGTYESMLFGVLDVITEFEIFWVPPV